MKSFSLLLVGILLVAVNSSSIKRLEDDDDSKLTVEEFIRKKGYPVERHEIISQDGYILTAFRIPHGKNENSWTQRPVAWIQHGVLGSTMDWMFNAHERFPFMMADNGYDVWLGNTRGNRHSRRHTTLDPDSKDYWDFSWDEMGKYDVPALIDHALAASGEEKLFWFGHSMGSGQFFVGMMENPEYNNKIRLMSAMAPATFIHQMESPAKGLAPFTSTLLDVWGPEFFPGPGLPDWIPEWLKDLIGIKDPERRTYFGTRLNLNESIVPLFWAHAPGGTSTRTIAQFGQCINYKDYKKFNFGPIKNMQLYNSLTPPSYDFSKITAPIALYYGKMDLFVDPKDIQLLASKLPNVVVNHMIEHEEFNHMDFLAHWDAPELLYNRMINHIKSF